MKAILTSIRPRHVCDILNLIKLWEIRKRFPKDYVGWVYIYCTKDSKNGWCMVSFRKSQKHRYQPFNKNAGYSPLDEYIGNGKVIARFWCDKVEEYVNGRKWSWKSGSTMWGACNDYEYILKDTCLTEDELYDYCEDLSFKAIHITKLEIFDKPKDISEFWNNGKKVKGHKGTYQYSKLTSAPQSWCYVEV